MSAMAWRVGSKTVITLVVLLLLAMMVRILTFSTVSEPGDLAFEQAFRKDYQIYALNIPDSLSFAGEPVPLNELDVHEKLDRELLVNTYWQSQTLLLVKRANRWFPVIEPILKKEGIPNDIKYIALIESGLTQVVSPAGATGVWQFMEDAALKYNLEINDEVDERYHIQKATLAACRYLKEAKKTFGTWTLAAASYNMGINGLSKQMKRQKTDNYYDLLLNTETARYIYRALALKTIMEDPDNYGFNLRKKDLYPPYRGQWVTVDTSIADFADFAIEHGINYKQLKLANPWLRQNYLTNEEGKSYQIFIPENLSIEDSAKGRVLEIDTTILLTDSIGHTSTDTLSMPADTTADE